MKVAYDTMAQLALCQLQLRNYRKCVRLANRNGST